MEMATDNLQQHESQTHTAEAQHVGEQEPHTEEDDACLEPEFVSGDAGLEDGEPAAPAERVADDEPEDDGPEDVLEFDAARDESLLGELAGVADGGQQEYSWKDRPRGGLPRNRGQQIQSNEGRGRGRHDHGPPVERDPRSGHGLVPIPTTGLSGFWVQSAIEPT